MLEQCPDVRTVVVCTGGGGLVAGIAAAVKARRPDVRVVAVQAAMAAAFPASLAAGVPVPLASMATMADGIAVAAPGDLTLAHVAGLVDEVRTVTEDELSRACCSASSGPSSWWSRPGWPPWPRAGRPRGLPGAGGGRGVRRQHRPGAHAQGRAARHGRRRPLPVAARAGADRPGSLAGLLRELAAVSANVLSVEHERTTAQLDLGEVEIAVVLETRGPDHAREVQAALTRVGYAVTSD